MALNFIAGYIHKKTVSWKLSFVYKHLNRCNTTFLKMILSNVSGENYTKRVFQENKARQIFRKTKISYYFVRVRIRG